MKSNEPMVRPVVEYTSIVQSLVEASNFLFKSGVVSQSGSKGAHCLREFKTVGFTAPRQMGKSQFIKDWIDAHPDDPIDVIMIDNNIKRDYIARHGRGPNVTIHLAESIRKMIENTKNIQMAIKRVTTTVDFTAAEVRAFSDKLYLDNRGGAPFPKWVLVDDASHVFAYHGIKHSGFYSLYSQSLTNEELPTIILVG